MKYVSEEQHEESRNMSRQVSSYKFVFSQLWSKFIALKNLTNTHLPRIWFVFTVEYSNLLASIGVRQGFAFEMHPNEITASQ